MRTKNMLDKIKNWFKSFSVTGNLESIKTFFTTAYSALQKVIVFINFTKDELEKNNIGANILKILPQVLSVIGMVLSLISKFGPLFGLNLPVQTEHKKGITADELAAELNEELEKLRKCCIK